MQYRLFLTAHLCAHFAFLNRRATEYVLPLLLHLNTSIFIGLLFNIESHCPHLSSLDVIVQYHLQVALLTATFYHVWLNLHSLQGDSCATPQTKAL